MSVPSSALGLPHPSPASECVPFPPNQRRREHIRLRVGGRGWGGPNSDD